MPVKVYTASKLRHAELWRALKWENVIWTARWPFIHVDKIPDTGGFAARFWEHDMQDVAKADLVLVYAEPEDKLRGALVEVGAALATGKKVIVIGEHEDYGTWQFHPNVIRIARLDEGQIL